MHAMIGRMIKKPSSILFAWLLPMVVAPAAHAADNLLFKGGVGVTYDDNLFRLHTNKKSDTIFQTTLGVDYKQRFSLQEIFLNASLVDSRYASNNHLDATAFNYDARWAYAISSRLTGDVAVGRTEVPNSFAEFTQLQQSRQRNLRVTESQRANLDFEVNPNWHLLGGVQHYTTKNEMTLFADTDIETKGGSVGLRYTPSTGNYIGVQTRRLNGHYMNRQTDAVLLYDNDFTDTGHELNFHWIASGHSTLRGRVERYRRAHSTFEQRDFSGWVGNLDYQYKYSEKTALTLAYARSLGVYQPNPVLNPTDVNSSYFLSNGLTFTAEWAATGSTVVSGFVGHARRRYLGEVAYADPANPTLGTQMASGRTENVTGLGVDVANKPYRWLELKAGVAAEKRNTNDGRFDYTDRKLFLSANAQF